VLEGIVDLAESHKVSRGTHRVQKAAKRTYHPHVIHRVSVDNRVGRLLTHALGTVEEEM
jgi:hypothetical protein